MKEKKITASRFPDLLQMHDVLDEEIYLVVIIVMPTAPYNLAVIMRMGQVDGGVWGPLLLELIRCSNGGAEEGNQGGVWEPHCVMVNEIMTWGLEAAGPDCIWEFWPLVWGYWFRFEVDAFSERQRGNLYIYHPLVRYARLSSTATHVLGSISNQTKRRADVSLRMQLYCSQLRRISESFQKCKAVALVNRLETQSRAEQSRAEPRRLVTLRLTSANDWNNADP